jgi:hypothetical protein
LAAITGREGVFAVRAGGCHQTTASVGRQAALA